MTSPRPYRPNDDEQPTAPYPFEASHPFEHLLPAQRAKPTQRVTQRPVHIDEQPTMVMPRHEWLEHVRMQRAIYIDYHAQQMRNLQRDANFIDSVELDGRAFTCNLHEDELLWQSDERRRRFLGSEVLRLRTEMSRFRLQQQDLWQQITQHEDAIRQLQAEMA